jgi:hypothetical protein
MQEFKENILQRNKGTRRGKIYIFAICFLISATIWCLIKLSSVYDAEVLYPVEFINAPEKKVIVNNVDSFLVIHIKTTGFKLLEYKFLKNPHPLKIDLSRLYKKSNTPENQEFFLLTSLLHYQLQQQVGSKNQLVSVKPDTLFFAFENSYFRKVPVKLKLDINFKKQYAIYDSIKLVPDSIMVSGAFKLLKEIGYIETEKKSISNLSANTELILRLKNNYPKNLISFPEKTVKVSLSVEKFTESVIELPVNLVNESKKTAVKIFPDKVKITYLVAMKDYKKINKDEFTVIADYSKHIDNTINVQLLRNPSKVRITKIDPEKIEYLLIK